jgi:hypothetical protein
MSHRLAGDSEEDRVQNALWRIQTAISDLQDDVAALRNGTRDSWIDALVEEWPLLTDEQRLAFLARFRCCRHCGSTDTRCQCMNDE